MNFIDIDELINVGAHFGHPTSRWNPQFRPFLATKKNGIHIIDLKQTSQRLNRAGKEVIKIIKDGGHVLFVGTKKQAKDAVQQAADRCGMYYIVERWLGGTLTNFATIKRSIKRLALLEKESSPIYENLTKKELSSLEREHIRLADLHRGIKDMKHLPSLLFFVDGIQEKNAISEARTLGIPVMGIVDSNTDPTIMDYPIPANDDSMKTINLIVNYISDCIIEASGGSVIDSQPEINSENAESPNSEEVDVQTETEVSVEVVAENVEIVAAEEKETSENTEQT